VVIFKAKQVLDSARRQKSQRNVFEELGYKSFCCLMVEMIGAPQLLFPVSPQAKILAYITNIAYHSDNLGAAGRTQ
jgi:hypothetical protein